MTKERAIRLARQWSWGGVATLQEGEAQEYHKLALLALSDPVHHAGGCYCRECIHRTDTGKCGHPRHEAYPVTYPNDFCNYGHRLEGAE